MNILDEVVEKMLKQHKGGEIFFDHLDDIIRNNNTIIEEILNLIPKKENNIIVSGNFGIFFNNYIRQINNNLNIIVVNGGLRKGKKITDLTYLKERIHNKEFIFVDDSFYSGKTRNTIKKEIERLGGKLDKTYVAYDGSKTKEDNVVSLYRYYN